MGKTAIILGGSGLVGSSLLKFLINDDSYQKLIVLTRRHFISHSKIEEVLVDFSQIESYRNQIKGEVLFSCLGTTIKNAKSQQNQYLVDYTYQWKVAKIGRYFLKKGNKVNKLIT